MQPGRGRRLDVAGETPDGPGGLAPVTVLSTSAAGRAALGGNHAVTGGIQTGAVRRPTLLPFADQQQLALRDAFITDGDLAQLADGLGTTLGAAYQARAHYIDRERDTTVSPALGDLIASTNAIAGSDSNAGKYVFADGTTDGKAPVSEEAAAILEGNGGAPDPFGRAYGRPAGSPGADAYGDSRPFQTEPSLLPIVGPDSFATPASNDVYNRGPISNLIDSPSYPSGHATYGYMGSILLAVLMPDRYRQMIVRGAEYGNDRILMGAHYAMDVLGGRTLATYGVTQTYGLPVVTPERAVGTENVGQLAPEAGYLLTVAFPDLSLDQADRILTETEGPGGGFLDDGSAFGVYSRLGLQAAAGRAAIAAAPR